MVLAEFSRVNAEPSSAPRARAHAERETTPGRVQNTRTRAGLRPSPDPGTMRAPAFRAGMDLAMNEQPTGDEAAEPQSPDAGVFGNLPASRPGKRSPAQRLAHA